MNTNPTGIHPDLVLGGVRFIRKLTAEGGQGEVWLASDLNLLRNVAVKCFGWPADAASHADTKKGWDHEAELWANIKHPNIAKLHKYEPHLINKISDTDSRHVKMFVIELAEASLSTMISTSWPPSIQIMLKWMAEIASGLVAAHSIKPEPIVHRDIKPGNVLLYRADGDDTYAAITDFGIARWQNEGTSKKWVGTPPFAAPEQHHGHYSTASDVYGLGMTFLDMLTGRKFKNVLRRKDDELHLFNRHAVAHAAPELENTQVTRELLDLIEQMTEEREDLRTITATEVRTRLRMLLRQSEGISDINLLRQHEEDDRTSRLRTLANRFVWNPHLHSAFNEALYFFYLRGFMSIRNMRTTISTVLHPVLHGRCCIYELFGEHDILIRAWINGGYGSVVDMIRSIATTMAGRCKVLKVREAKYSWITPNDDVRIDNAKDLLTRLVGQYKDESLINELKEAKLILGNIEPVIPPKVKIFTHITAIYPRQDRDLYADVKQLLETELPKLKESITAVSLYLCHSEQDGDSVLIKYNAADFHHTRLVPYLMHDKLADFKVRTDTFLVSDSSDEQSDDGPFLQGRWDHS